MADRTVRAIFEARVEGARKNISGLGKDTADAGKKVDALTKDLKGLDAQKVKPKIDVAIDAAKKSIKDITAQLGELRTMDVTPEVTADIRKAERSLADARKALRQLDAAKATMKVDVDTAGAKSEIYGLSDDIASAGTEGGQDAGDGIVTGILDALRTIPIAGAIIGVGVVIAGGILLGIQQGLAIEAERDLFSAQTGLDEATSARFGRAAGEAYANAWGESVAANLDTARLALQAGLIDSDATDAEIENVIAKLTGITDLFDYDVTMAVQGVGNLIKTGLVRDADEAFDLIVKSSQKLPSDDLLETLNEYSNQFATMGIDGKTAFGLIVQGAQAGARDTDKVADSLKELGLRIREGLDPARDALKTLGLNVDGTIAAFTKGGPDAEKAINKVFDAIRRLEEKGGNTQAVIAALFGGPGEDLGAALFALDVDKAGEALDGVEGSAGAAERALTTMADNTAAKMESAKRNVELAMDGIKGALAEAFGDDIAGAAEWVAKNRAPMLEFFISAVNGTIDIAEGFANLGATALDTIADIADGFADLIDSLPQWLVGGEDLSTGLRDVASGARGAADAIRDEVPAALDDVRLKISSWAGPELLKARIHDATAAMTADLEKFALAVGDKDLKVRINGETMNAEEVLATLVDNINAEDGTVTINGDRIPAEEALDEVLANIRDGAAEISIGADTGPAETSAKEARGRISLSEATIYVDADLTRAERELKEFKARIKTLGIRVSGVSSVGGVHEGGWTGRILPGRYTGGWVPGSDPGYDNVLWPLNSGGRTLAQPLAGGEYVVRSEQAGPWGPLLEWINAGGMPPSHTETHDSSLKAEVVNFYDADSRSWRRDMRAKTYEVKGKPGRE